MKLQPMLVAAAIALTPVIAFAQGSAGSSAATDTTRSSASDPNRAVNSNCSPGSMSQRPAGNSAMNNNSSSNAMADSANCGRTARGSSSMTNRGNASSAYGSSAGPAGNNASTTNNPGR